MCSCLRVFENLELTCAVGQLVFETLQAHHKVYNTGSGCLLFLAGAWSRAALECLHRGISVPHIISAMSEGIDVCMDVFKKCSISTEGLGAVQSESYGATTHGLQLSKKSSVEALQASSHLQGRTSVGDHKTLNSRKIKLSRYFCEATSKNTSTLPQRDQPKLPNMAYIAAGLRHGCFNAMNLVVQASQVQSKNNPQDHSCCTFDISKMVTCLLPGLPEEHACVLPGCFVLVSAEQASVAHRLKEQHLKVALIHGDLSETFRHLGFSQPKGMKHVSDQLALSNSSKEEEWMMKVVTLLLSLGVNLILVSGLASEKMIHCCCRHEILVVEKVKTSALKAFANAAGGVPVTYATQLKEQCVGTGVKVVIWKELRSPGGKFTTAVNISTGANSGLVTVILTSCVHGKLQALDDQFWACAHRVHHALRDKALLPGAGVTEMLCIHHLQKRAGHHVKHCAARTGGSQQQSRAEAAANAYKSVVLQLLADGLIDYISTVMANTGRFTKVKARTVVSQQLQDCKGHLGIATDFSPLLCEGETEDSSFSDTALPMKIYDNLSVKQEAWRKALDLVFLVIQTDAEVITGVDQRSEGAKKNVMLL